MLTVARIEASSFFEALSGFESKIHRQCASSLLFGAPNRIPCGLLDSCLSTFCRRAFWSGIGWLRRHAEVRPQYSTLHLQIRVNAGDVCPGKKQATKPQCVTHIHAYEYFCNFPAASLSAGEGRGVDLFRPGSTFSHPNASFCLGKQVAESVEERPGVFPKR